MLAQRSNAEQIDALEIDRSIRTMSIILKTPLERPFILFHAGLDEFVEEPEDDMI
jgi:tRNA1Val (adenine37-N6)-methyltransferase